MFLDNGIDVVEETQHHLTEYKSIKEVIDCLINIEASFNKDINASLLYKEKFMSLITDEFVDLNLSEYFSDYQNYAYSEIKKKLLRR